MTTGSRTSLQFPLYMYTYESHYPSNVFALSNLKLQLWVPIPLLSPPFWRYVPEAVLFPTDPNFLQFHKVFEAFQVRSCPYISLYTSLCRKSQYRVSIEVVVNNVTFIGSRFSSTSLWSIDSISFLSWLHVAIATCFYMVSLETLTQALVTMATCVIHTRVAAVKSVRTCSILSWQHITVVVTIGGISLRKTVFVWLTTGNIGNTFWNYTSQGCDRWNLSIVGHFTHTRVIISNGRLLELTHIPSVV